MTPYREKRRRQADTLHADPFEPSEPISPSPREAVPHARILAENPDGRLSADNAHYLTKVLRLRPGARFFLTDGSGLELLCQLQDSETYVVLSSERPQREAAVDFTVFLPLLKGDRLDYLIEKLVELGVTRFVPFLSRYSCVTTPSESKQARWNNIARAAMLQAGGCLVPRFEPVTTLAHLPPPDDQVLAFVLHEIAPNEAAEAIPDLVSASGLSIREVRLLSGPEGGLSGEEVGSLERAGWRRLWLGTRRLRADTAPIAALAGLHCHWRSLMGLGGPGHSSVREPGSKHDCRA